MATRRLWGTLSAFNPPTRRWVPISSRNRNAQSQVAQRLCLTSWNIDAFSPRAVTRARLILSHILAGPKSPDIIILQEVTLDVRTALLNDARVRAALLATDAEDDTSFEQVPFATMTFLSRACFAFGLGSQKDGDAIERGGKLMFGCVSRMTLPSKYGRDALCVDIISPTAPDTAFRLINVHLGSLWDAFQYRAQQMEILADVLREPGCGGGIIAGDFNAISPKDDALVDENKLVDAWVALHGRADPGGATWGVGLERRDGLGPGRLDKIAMIGLKAKEMQILRPGSVELPRPGGESVEIPWSDHCGLRRTFTILNTSESGWLMLAASSNYGLA